MSDDTPLEYAVKRVEPESWLNCYDGTADKLAWYPEAINGTWYGDRWQAENLRTLAGMDGDDNIIIDSRPIVWEEDIEPDEIDLELDQMEAEGKL